MIKQRNLIGLLTGIIIGLVLSFILIGSGAIAKKVKEPLGKWYISTYHVSDNTPSGSRATSSGARATEYVTAAVDDRNPLVPMNSKIKIKGLGEWIVKDNGHFGHYNHGKRALDLFMPEGVGGLFYRPVWLIRDETPKEKRLRKERERAAREERRRQLQQKPMRLVYDPSLLPWQVKTYRGVVKGGTIRIRSKDETMYYFWLDVVGTYPGESKIIYSGDRVWCQNIDTVYIEEACEEAVG